MMYFRHSADSTGTSFASMIKVPHKRGMLPFCFSLTLLPLPILITHPLARSPCLPWQSTSVKVCRVQMQYQMHVIVSGIRKRN